MKYNKAGGVIYTSMRITDRTEDILTCEFQIRDTGIGMYEEFIQNKLFEPFVQGRDECTYGKTISDGSFLPYSEKCNGMFFIES